MTTCYKFSFVDYVYTVPGEKSVAYATNGKLPVYLSEPFLGHIK
jgi:hypothetical protein